jgi:hypothetical protein
MTKGNRRPDRQQPIGLGHRRLDPDAESLGRPPEQQRVTNRLRRGDQQQPLRLDRQLPESPPEALLDPPRKRQRVWQTEPAPQLGWRQPPRQLQQRQRIPARLSNDPLPHALIQRNVQDRA